MKVVTIVGARPQFIKAASVSRELSRVHREIIVHTGQHYDLNMSDIFFQELGVPEPNYHLGAGSGSHGAQTGFMLKAIEEVLIEERPDVVLVYGDTNSTLAGAIAAAKLNIPLAHIEAGVRSYNRTMPEEINRVLTDHAASILLCPTRNAVTNLRHEGVVKGVFFSGDVMYDNLLYFLPTADYSILDALNLKGGEYLLATIHRPVNTDDPDRLEQIIQVLNKADREVVWPLHPRTQKSIEVLGLRSNLGENIRTIKPVGYLTALALIREAYMVLTDSGGLQKEAYLLETPCVTLREETEWPETLKGGWNVLTGTEPGLIREALERLSPDKPDTSAFGNGQAAREIVKLLEENI